MGTRVFGMLVQGFESGSGAAVSTESRQGQRCQDRWGQYLGMKIDLLLNVWPKARIKKLDEGSSAAPSVHVHQSGKWWKSWVDRVRYSRKRDCALALSDGAIWVGISWPAADGIHGSKHEVGATASPHHAVGRKDFGAAIWHSRSFFYSWIIKRNDWKQAGRDLESLQHQCLHHGWGGQAERRKNAGAMKWFREKGLWRIGSEKLHDGDFGCVMVPCAVERSLAVMSMDWSCPCLGSGDDDLVWSSLHSWRRSQTCENGPLLALVS